LNTTITFNSSEWDRVLAYCPGVQFNSDGDLIIDRQLLVEIRQHKGNRAAFWCKRRGPRYREDVYLDDADDRWQ
jgi:hypothetical protein